jgi:septum formation topological specificity factor MinE
MGLRHFRAIISNVVGGPRLHLQALTIAERTIHTEEIEEMEKELMEVINDFDRAVDVEALRLAKRSGKLSLAQCSYDSFSVASFRARAFTSAAQTRRDWL